MREGERKACLGVIGDREFGWAPALYSVAVFAASAVGTIQKLPVVWIGFVTIGTDIVRNGRLEIAALVTTDACQIRMLSLQGELRFGVVECCGKC